MSNPIAYKATGPAGHVTRDTPRAAALAYFQCFPRARKCTVLRGEVDGAFFVLRITREPNLAWRNVTKAGVATLPDTVQP